MANRYRDARDNVVEDAQRNIWLIYDVEQQIEQIEQESQTRKGFESICEMKYETVRNYLALFH